MFRVSIVGVDGLIKSVSLCICLVIPGGSVPVVIALSMISLWCIAWMILKYCLLVCLVAASGGWSSGIGCARCCGVLCGGVVRCVFCVCLCVRVEPFSGLFLCVDAALCE